MRLDQIQEYIELKAEFEEMSEDRKQRLAAAIQGADKGSAVRYTKYIALSAAFAAMQGASHPGLEEGKRAAECAKMAVSLRLAEQPEQWAEGVLKEK